MRSADFSAFFLARGRLRPRDLSTHGKAWSHAGAAHLPLCLSLELARRSTFTSATLYNFSLLPGIRCSCSASKQLFPAQGIPE